MGVRHRLGFVTPRLALTIGGLVAFGFAIALLLFPEPLLAGSRLDASAQAISLSRGAGATLAGLAVINWMARSATGDVVRALLVGNFVVQALSLAVNAGGVLAGELPPQAATASVVHIVLGAVFILALRRN